MTNQQIAALTQYVRSAVASAVAEATGNNEWMHDRLDKHEEVLINLLREPPKENRNDDK
jgi:hypothetical protein